MATTVTIISTTKITTLVHKIVSIRTNSLVDTTMQISSENTKNMTTKTTTIRSTTPTWRTIRSVQFQSTPEIQILQIRIWIISTKWNLTAQIPHKAMEALARTQLTWITWVVKVTALSAPRTPKSTKNHPIIRTLIVIKFKVKFKVKVKVNWLKTKQILIWKSQISN